MPVSEHDRGILRELAREVADVAALPDHARTAELWRRLNDLQSIRPMVRIYQLPWRELDVDGELELHTEDPWARGVERQFRETLYQWKHMRWDMVVEPVFHTPYVVHSTGYGIEAEMDQIPHDEAGGVTAKHYNCQIADEADVDKIQFPELTLDQEATERLFQRASDLFEGILDVRVQGRVAHNYSPWDRLAEWCNPQQVLMDLALRPEFVHAAMERLTSAFMCELDQVEALDIPTLSSGNYGVGQGGLGYTDDLPAPKDSSEPVRLRHQWGGSQAQIFSEVSPAMHEEFALAYEKRILDRFGLNYYGCCEQLDAKVDVISRNLPKLRKISMSAWTDPQRGADAIAGRFVFSAKPNPAFFATDGTWDRVSAGKELEGILAATEGKNVELILKDVSTVRFEPARVWEWAEMAMTMAGRYSDA
ncbi:hypothetical protein ACFL01_02275 [Planctomycetota bacterium]